jgi:hypothetical protein
MVLFDAAFAFVYLSFFLLLPKEIETNVLMVIALATGLVVDIFYDSLGIHSSVLILIAFVRNRWLSMVTPRGGYEQGAELTIRDNGFQWYFTYAYPLILAHHLLLFYIEAGNNDFLLLILKKAFFSSVFTFVFIVSLQLLMAPRRRRF